jgi:hypothetical protein
MLCPSGEPFEMSREEREQPVDDHLLFSLASLSHPLTTRQLAFSGIRYVSN